ncbi:HAMP domain-containing histidine kinase [Stenotrophomonas sp. STM01]|uniref:sensor histidine kinase n=1 Tax=Stenotrophomonas sp. STM01 TaxID=2769278 RepID=UPI00177CCD52|nr:HAMP domain-containing sensor histidine kinase [Stenotrophomonas sp. STM01]MBD9534939.1 HAMP domain-containing histidine kinase [Stenotrophomonas sp. STM01]
MSRRSTLRRKLLGWLGIYLALITLVVFSAANYVHEHAEHAVWRSLLNTELDSVLAHMRMDRDYHWQDSDTLHLFIERGGAPIPESMATLHPGLHDGALFLGKQTAVMVRDTSDYGRVILALDITDFGELEHFITRWSLLAGVALVIVTLLMAWLGVARLVRPLSALASDIAALRPEQRGQRVAVDRRGSAEMEVIAGALNDYLQRNEHFVERERAFISAASHELRTPVAVISGAAELALEQPELPPRARQQLERVRGTAQGVEQLIQLLLVLARDPARLSAMSELLAVEQLLPEIIEDHRHLACGKELDMQLHAEPCRIIAPMGVVQAAIGNLLRNAIENSDRGMIRISASAQAVVTIEDPGHGMSPEEVAQLYARLAKGERNPGSGIGMDLIARLCDHLGWELTIQSQPERGTRVTLDMGSSLPPDSA